MHLTDRELAYRSLSSREMGSEEPCAWNSTFLVMIVLVAFAIRIAFLEAPSVWVDEMWTKGWAQMSPSTMIADLALDHVPLYYLLLQVWVKFVGFSVFSLRTPSVLAGTLVVAQIYSLGRTLYSRKVGVIAALIGAISPFLVFYSRMARPYPLLWLCSIVTINAYLQAFRSRKRSSWLLFALSASAAAYTHFTAIPILAFLGVHALLHWRRLKPQLPQWILAHCMIAVSFLPFSMNVIRMVTDDHPVTVGRGDITLWHIADIFVSWNLGHRLGTSKATLAVSAASFGLVTAFGIAAIARNRLWSGSDHGTISAFLSRLLRLSREVPEVLLLGCSLSVLGVAVAAKLLKSDRLPFSARNFSVASVPYYILLASGVERVMRPVLRRVILIALCLAMVAAALLSVDMGAGIDWRYVAHRIQSNERPNDAVLIIPGGHYIAALKIYYTGSPALHESDSQWVTMENVAGFLTAVSGSERVWLITINEAQFDTQDLIGQRFATYCALEEQETLIPKHAHLRLYGRCGFPASW